MHRFILAAVLLAVLVPFSSPAQSAAAPSSAPTAVVAAEDAVLQAGDMIQVTVWRKEELSGEFSIAANGSIDHPLYQEVVVGGSTLAVARERLRAYLQGWEENPYLHIKPLYRVAVGGEVQRPNLYVHPPEVTIAQAVAAAGGVTSKGRLSRVRVVRGGETLFIDLTDPVSPTGMETVRSGDQIIVERRTAELFREYVFPAGSLIVGMAGLARLILQ